MHKSASPRGKKVGLLALAGTALLGLVSGFAFLAGITPAMAATLASRTDTQVAVFMIPLALLLLTLLYQVARLAWRGTVPAPTPAPRPRRLHWAPGRGEG